MQNNAELAADRRRPALTQQAPPRYDGPERRSPHLHAQLWGVRRHPLRLAPSPWPQGNFHIDPEA